ncbi:superoxide dismutase family protein [Cohnella silvisoli]|uniref:Superoxide dismutase [Cu-Zn] n=1 Tax=Cohnella silvisoli TaxID=2873699 RepID=A0ABV1L106_9BACL|nr:superoxide dismutase family protein [Cohnella silvisoli]MCD9025345.1 superoxide dismutase family protein [Cohnella silvisoli]
MKTIVVSVYLSVISFLLLGTLPVTPTAYASSGETQKMVKIINTKGEQVGAALLIQKAGAVQLHIEAKHLPPGVHGIHFHEIGKCDTPDFKSAGEHLNPNKKQHGFHNPKGFHAGDLPNIQVKQDGTVIADLESRYVTLMTGMPNSLLKPGGTALVIHEKEDDYVTDPSGNSGNRIACGPIL